MVRYRIFRYFQTYRQMLYRWQDLTSRMYPNHPDLLERIPQASELTMTKLADVGWVMTDTFNAARKYNSMLIESIN